MPRKPRFALPGVPQHVIPRGNNRARNGGGVILLTPLRGKRALALRCAKRTCDATTPPKLSVGSYRAARSCAGSAA